MGDVVTAAAVGGVGRDDASGEVASGVVDGLCRSGEQLVGFAAYLRFGLDWL
ncbi:hypothetical protein [Saccharothrix longispora]|uniref:hypothetical protein n=1 Tax=Saccharothrix longispora TaxID=33920 RepID=UPI0028FD3F58|nr:hypothetical protein [Saccharothrix longispora]MDU0294965.1 hypothetical protein [Saccharothrix longispora]